MIKVAKISKNSYVEDIFLISDNKKNIDDFIKNELGLSGNFIEINDQNSKNFDCGVGFFYDKKNNFFSYKKPEPWFIFDSNKKEWICPNYLDPETGNQKSEKDILYQRILSGIPKNIKYMGVD